MSDNPLSPQPLAQALARTPARLAVGRAGPAYRTATTLQLRADHAAARDAVAAEFDLLSTFEPTFVKRYDLFAVQTLAESKLEYLRRPDLGRKLSYEAKTTLREQCPAKPDVQVIIGDGLSELAVRKQVPPLIPFLLEEFQKRDWSVGRPFAVKYCRVGVLNDVGEVLEPKLAILLIGERPGLATAESLSAYLAYSPRPGHTDDRRNLVSNIHARGLGLTEAAERIARMGDLLMAAQSSGVGIGDVALS